MIKIDCRKCKNCTGESCKVYGNNPNVATSKCAKNGFRDYNPHKCVDCKNFIKALPKKWNRGKCKLGYRSCLSEKSIVCVRNFEKGGVQE